MNTSETLLLIVNATHEEGFPELYYGVFHPLVFRLLKSGTLPFPYPYSFSAHFSGHKYSTLLSKELAQDIGNLWGWALEPGRDSQYVRLSTRTIAKMSTLVQRAECEGVDYPLLRSRVREALSNPTSKFLGDCYRLYVQNL